MWHVMPQIQDDIKNMQNFQFSSKTVSISLQIHLFYCSVSLLELAPVSYQTVETRTNKVTKEQGFASDNSTALRYVKFSVLVSRALFLTHFPLHRIPPATSVQSFAWPYPKPY